MHEEFIRGFEKQAILGAVLKGGGVVAKAIGRKALSIGKRVGTGGKNFVAGSFGSKGPGVAKWLGRQSMRPSVMVGGGVLTGAAAGATARKPLYNRN